MADSRGPLEQAAADLVERDEARYGAAEHRLMASTFAALGQPGAARSALYHEVIGSP